MATFFRTPERRCFATNRFYVDLAVQNILFHQSKSSIPNLDLQFYYPILTKTECKIEDWKNHPPCRISNLTFTTPQR